MKQEQKNFFLNQTKPTKNSNKYLSIKIEISMGWQKEDRKDEEKKEEKNQHTY